MSYYDIYQIDLLLVFAVKSERGKWMKAKKSATKQSLRKGEYEALASFRYALRRFLRFSEEAVEAVGLTPQQHQALLAIKGFVGREHITNGELAEQLHIRHHSAVGLINRLAAQKLIVREQAEGDRRKVNVRLTPRGEQLLSRLTATHKEELRLIAPQLSTLMESLKDDE